MAKDDDGNNASTAPRSTPYYISSLMQAIVSMEEVRQQNIVAITKATRYMEVMGAKVLSYCHDHGLEDVQQFMNHVADETPPPVNLDSMQTTMKRTTMKDFMRHMVTNDGQVIVMEVNGEPQMLVIQL